MLLHNFNRLVIKIGSRLLIDENNQRINTDWLGGLVEDIVDLRNKGIHTVIVTSGASACGHLSLGLQRQYSSLNQQQAAASVGQIQLMEIYQRLLKKHNIRMGQVLVSLSDTETRRNYINLQNTLESLLKLNIIPIINENDSVATAELRYGDNDRLAARIAQMTHAGALILLSDIDGLYTSDPRHDPTATFISDVPKLTSAIKNMAQDSRTEYGSGGMITKLAAAEISTASGCGLLIIKGAHKRPLSHYQKTQHGTWFHPQQHKASAKQTWLHQHQQPSGIITIDAGAANALNHGKSLLPVGIKMVNGNFTKGDTLKIIFNETIIAYGLSNYCTSELEKIKGHHSEKFMALLGYVGCDEAIHRNNLALLPQTLQEKPA